MMIYVVLLLSSVQAKQSDTRVYFDENGVCQYTPISYYKSTIYQERIPVLQNNSSVVENAKSKGKQKYLDEVCANRSEEECAVIRSYTDMVQYNFSSNQTELCMLFETKVDILHNPASFLKPEEKMQQEIVALLKTIQQKYPKKTVFFDPQITTSSGCMVDATGEDIRNRLSTEANKLGMEVSRDPSNDFIHITSKILKNKKSWSVRVETNYQEKSLQLGSFEYPSAFVGQDLETECEKMLSISKSTPKHSSGLTVSLNMAGKVSFCEGDTYNLDIHGSADMDIRLFSMMDDNNQVLVYPHIEHKGQETYTPKQDFAIPMEMIPMASTPQREKILVLAVPKGADFGWLKDRKGPCVLTEAMDTWIPTDVAYDILEYTVYPAGLDVGKTQCDFSKLSLEKRESNNQAWMKLLQEQATDCR